MPRELLKFRKGDVGLKITKDGKLELAGVTPDLPMIDNAGNVNPALLFAAAWVRKDPEILKMLVENFKTSVAEGIFGEDAQREYKTALKIKHETPPPPFLNPEKAPTHFTSDAKEELVLPADSKPRVIDHDPIGNEFETMADAASGAVTLTDGGCGNAESDSGAVTFDQPMPYDMSGMLKGRDS